jgi:hypothetical protein
MGKSLNAAMKAATGDYLLYIDNLAAEVILKQSFTATALLLAERSDIRQTTERGGRFGMLYADYDLIADGQKRKFVCLSTMPAAA